MDAQTRRRERRAEKQAQWKAANPLLVGVSAKPVRRDHFRLLHYKARLGISRPFCYQKSTESTAAG